MTPQLRAEIVRWGIALRGETQGPGIRKANLVDLLSGDDLRRRPVPGEGAARETGDSRSRSLSPPRGGSRVGSRLAPLQSAGEDPSPLDVSQRDREGSGESTSQEVGPVPRLRFAELPEVDGSGVGSALPNLGDRGHVRDLSPVSTRSSLPAQQPRDIIMDAAVHRAGPAHLDSTEDSVKNNITAILHRQGEIEQAIGSISKFLQSSSNSLQGYIPLSESQKIKSKWSVLPTAERAAWVEAEKIGHRTANWWAETGILLEEIVWRIESGYPPASSVLFLQELMSHCRFRSQYGRTMMVEGIEIAEKFAEQPVPLEPKPDFEKILKLARKSVDRIKKSGSSPSHTICFNCLRSGHVSSHCPNPTAPGANTLLAARGRGRGFGRGSNFGGTPPEKSKPV